MSHLDLSFPAYVTYDSTWTATPLFGPGELVGHGRDPGSAVDALEAVIGKRYEEVHPHDTDALQWLSFEPSDLQTPRVPLFLDPRGADQRLVLIGTFTLGQHRYVVVPRLGRWFRLPAAQDYAWALQHAVTKHLRALQDEGELEVPTALVMKRDRVMPARRRLMPRIPALKLGTAGFEALFAAMRGGGNEGPSRALASISDDLCERRERMRTLGADVRVDAVTSALLGEPPGRLALVGPAGSGRTTLVHEAVSRLVSAAEQERRQRTYDAIITRTPLASVVVDVRRVMHLDPQRIVTGQSVVGQWQRRLERALSWLVERRQKVGASGADALFVDDVIALARVGRSSGSDMTASTVLRDWLEREAFPMVLEATQEQWHRLTELDRAFADLFRVVHVEPPARDQALAIAVRHAAALEPKGPRVFAATAVTRALELATRFTADRALPASVVEALSRASEGADYDDDPIGAAFIDGVFGEVTGLRPDILDDAKALPDDALRAELGAKVMGQPDAVDALAYAVHAYKSRLRSATRPVACYLFVGPTGVGKTEASKALASTLFDRPDALVRFDMNAFADGYAQSRLIGSYDAPEGLLTQAVRRHPYAVLLLDEIEKADPSVHDLLLQVLDEGRLTDAAGRTTSFVNTVVILTSNVGASDASKGVGFARDADAVMQVYRSAVAKVFRPEFLNRIDRVVPFRGLSQEDLRGIARIQLEHLLARDGFAARTVIYDVSDALLDEVAAAAFDPRFGARGLKRAIERRLVQSAATVLAGLTVNKPVRLTARQAGDDIRFDTAPLAWADAIVPATPDDRPLDDRLEALEVQLAPLRPPSGLVATSPRPPEADDHEEILLLLDEVRSLSERVQAPERPLSGAAEERVRRLANVPKLAQSSFDVRRLRTVGNLRELLREAAQRPAEPTPASITVDVALAEVRAAAMIARAPKSAQVTLRSAVRLTAGFHAAVKPAIDAWRALARRMGAELDLKPTADGWSGKAEGSGFIALLMHERGLHWWATDPVPYVVALDVAVDGEVSASNAIVRVTCPPVDVRDAGVVHDLRTGALVAHDAVADALPSWLLAAHSWSAR